MGGGGEQTQEPRPLRISYLLQQFPVPTETFAVSDVAALLAQGHEVTVYTMKWRPKHEQALLRASAVPEKLAILRPSWTGAVSWPRLVWRKRKSASLLFRRILALAPSAPLTALQALLCIPPILEIVADIERSDSDVVHAFWARHSGLVLPVLRAKGARALRTSFVGAHDLVADDFLVAMTLDAAEVIFSHAEANRAYVEAKAPEAAAVHIIHRGIPLPELSAESDRDRSCWITASALSGPKNVDAVVRAFAVARSREPELKLQVFGDGPDRRRLEQLCRQLGCSGRVQFMGHRPRDELFAHMQRAGVFLLLSKKPSERLPNVLKEALWAGCAVVSSNTDGIDELIPNSTVGLVVDPDDTDALMAAVSAVMMQSDEQAAERRQRARAHVADCFSSECSMRRYVEAWRAAISAAGR